MIGYFDESIIYVKGKAYLFLGLIVFTQKMNDNIILKEFRKTKSPLKNKSEIKYSNARNEKIKHEILRKIKAEAAYFDSIYLEISSERDMRVSINLLITILLFNLEEKHLLNKVRLIYDKYTYQVREKNIYENFPFVKSFEMANSLNEVGLQYADWIAGEAGELFSHIQKNQA